MIEFIKRNWYTTYCGSILVLQLVFTLLNRSGVVSWSLWVEFLPSILLLASVLLLVILISLAFNDDDWEDSVGYGLYD